MCDETKENLACLMFLPGGEAPEVSRVLPLGISQDTRSVQRPALAHLLGLIQVCIEGSGPSCYSLELSAPPFTPAVSHSHSQRCGEWEIFYPRFWRRWVGVQRNRP